MKGTGDSRGKVAAAGLRGVIVPSPRLQTLRVRDYRVCLTCAKVKPRIAGLCFVITTLSVIVSFIHLGI